MSNVHMQTAVPGGSLDRPAWVRWLPLIVIQIYLTVSVLVFAFGPWPWPISNPVQLYAFLLFAQVALYLGYRKSARKVPTAPPQNSRVRGLVSISIILNLMWIFPIFMMRMGRTDLTPSAIMEAIGTGLRDSSTVYAQKLDPTMSLETAKVLDYLSMPLWPVLWLAVPLGAVYWRRLTFAQRFGVVLVALLNLSTWVAIGTNKGLVDLALMLPWLLLAHRLQRRNLVRLRAAAKAALFLVLGLCVVGSYFAHTIESRSGGEARDYDYGANIFFNEQSVLARVLPGSLGPLLGAGASYLTQGYYGLSLSLEEPYVPTYGFGNSWWTIGLSRRIFGPDAIADATYPGRIEGRGWDRFLRWHSVYPWLASDVTFPGTLLIVFLIGRLLALVWLDVLFVQQPVSIALFSLLILMLFYFPANNQILASPHTAIPFWTFLSVWFVRRRARRRPSTPQLWVSA